MRIATLTPIKLLLPAIPLVAIVIAVVAPDSGSTPVIEQTHFDCVKKAVPAPPPCSGLQCAPRPSPAA